MEAIKILFLADTHLGFDLPFKPRISRRRRGDDFFNNFKLALQPALEGKVDLVIHGGDLFYRSLIPDRLLETAMLPLQEVAEKGIPVYLVPGNHERSRIPPGAWSDTPNLFVFDRPRTFLFQKKDLQLTISGFPFIRKIRDEFARALQQTAYHEHKADLRILCMHQAVEGAQVGPADYTFRFGEEVLPGRSIPPIFSAVLSGHIHRSQILKYDLQGRPLPAPVIYPGSIERTSFAESEEEKHFALLELRPDNGPGKLVFRRLPARPMVSLEIDVSSCSAENLNREIKSLLESLDPDSVVRIKPLGEPSAESLKFLSDPNLRELAPASMNISAAINWFKKNP